MKMRYFAAVAAISAVYVVPAMAQTDSATGTSQAATKQQTQGVPSSLANPQYGNDTATKQKTQGVPAALNNPQYGSDAVAKKQQ